MILLECDVCKDIAPAPTTGSKRGETPAVTLTRPEWVILPPDARLGTYVGLRLCSAKCARVVVDPSPTLVLVNPPSGPPYSTHPQVGRLLALDEFDGHWCAGDLDPAKELVMYVGWTEHSSIWDRSTGEFIRGRPHRTTRLGTDHVVATGGELEGWTIEPQYLAKVADAQPVDVTRWRKLGEPHDDCCPEAT